MRAYVGVTDGDWYRSLASRGATEANFWQPSGGGRGFRAIERGDPFLFKSHARDGNRIVGGGIFVGWAPLSTAQAWDFFGPNNGCASLAEMRARIARYRRAAAPGPDPDPEIGCIMLNEVRFFPAEQQPAAPPDWSPNIVQGKGYDLATSSGRYVEQVFADLVAADHRDLLDAGLTGSVPGDMFGTPTMRPVRLGQGSFRALVQEAYGRRCAVTGGKIVPVLQASHIRPVAEHGQHRVDNGLLLRSDIHTLFDAGYLGVHPERKTLLVSRRLRVEYGNGEEFYDRARSGVPIRLPERRADQPNAEFLRWHADTVFLST